MTELPPRVRAAILLRSLAVQGSWNYETLIGTGFAFALLPALRMAGAREEAVRSAMERHLGIFNSHPYLATVAVGAVARLEAEGVDPRVVERFKSAMRGSLGALGDQLVWSAWRPASALLAMVLLLAGAAWWVAVAAFLLVYNGLHLTLRSWGLRIGFASGLEVGRALREAPLQAIAGRAADVGAVLCGMAVVLAVRPLGFDPARLAAVALAVGIGLWLGLATRRVVAGAVVLLWLGAMVYSWIQ